MGRIGIISLVIAGLIMLCLQIFFEKLKKISKKFGDKIFYWLINEKNK